MDFLQTDGSFSYKSRSEYDLYHGKRLIIRGIILVMKLVVGLGNPGEKYEHTRHNLGFMAVDRFLQDCKKASETTWTEESKFKSLIAECLHKSTNEKILLLKPLTHMNASGLAVKAAGAFYNIEPNDIWIVHDELDLPLGSMKIRNGGSSAGHRGIESIMHELGTEKFWRFRLGIGVNRNHQEVGGHIIHNVDDFVLGPFAHGEIGKVRELIKRASDAIQCALDTDMAIAGSRFNTK